jgi:hypothetical protein
MFLTDASYKLRRVPIGHVTPLVATLSSSLSLAVSLMKCHKKWAPLD